MKRPIESDYISLTAYTRALEEYCDTLAQPEQEPVCPDCKAKVLYECVACSSNNYPPKTTQEPVAWRAPNWGHGDDEWVYRDFDDPVLIADGKPSPNNEALYITPPQPKEPAIIGSYLEKDKELMENAQGDLERINLVQTGVGITQRTWVGLNDEQMRKICGSVSAMREAVREAETILKEGNT